MEKHMELHVRLLACTYKYINAPGFVGHVTSTSLFSSVIICGNSFSLCVTNTIENLQEYWRIIFLKDEKFRHGFRQKLSMLSKSQWNKQINNYILKTHHTIEVMWKWVYAVSDQNNRHFVWSISKLICLTKTIGNYNSK